MSSGAPGICAGWYQYNEMSIRYCVPRQFVKERQEGYTELIHLVSNQARSCAQHPVGKGAAALNASLVAIEIRVL